MLTVTGYCKILKKNSRNKQLAYIYLYLSSKCSTLQAATTNIFVVVRLFRVLALHATQELSS